MHAERRQLSIAIGIIFVMSGVLFWPVFRGQMPLPVRSMPGLFYGQPDKPSQPSIFRDRIVQTYPYHLFAVNSIQNGQVPMWNDLIFAGTPFFANGQAGIFSPFKALWWWLPPWLSFNIITLLQFAVSGVGMYLLGRWYKWRWPAATAAAVAFVFSGPFVLRATVLSMSATIAWLPWIFWSIHRLHEKLEWRRAMWLSLVLSAAMLSGHIQLAFLSVGLSFIWAIIWWRRDMFRRRALLFGAAFILSLGLTAVQLLPAQEASQQAYRQPLKISWRQVLAPSRLFNWQSRSAASLATIVDPNIIGSPQSYRGPANYIESNLFLGGVAAPMLLFSILAWRSKLWRWLVIVCAGVIWILVFPATMTLLGKFIPPLTLTPVWRLSFFLIFGLAMLIGLGFDQCLRRWEKIGPIVLVIMVVTTLWQWRGILPFGQRSELFAPSPLLNQTKQLVGGGRLWPVDGALDHYMPYGIPVIYGYDSLYPRTYLELWQANSEVRKRNQLHAKDINPNLLAVIGANTIITRQAVPAGWTEVGSDGDWRIAETNNPVEPIHTVNEVIFTQDPSQLGNIDPKKQALIDLFLTTDPKKQALMDISPPNLDPEAQATSRVVSQTATKLVVSVATSGRTMLVTNLQYYPGWRLSIDSLQREAQLVNYAFLGAFVESGQHQVVFEYKPASFRIGVIISLATLFAVLVAMVFLRGRVRSSKNGNHNPTDIPALT